MEFKQVKIEDVADVTKLAGFEFTKYIKYNETGEIIALRAINIRNNTLDLTDIKRIDKSISESLIRSKLYKDDIILTYTGNGAGAAAIIDENDKYHLAPNICKITPKEINPYYLYKYITSNKFQKEISNNIGGSGQPTIPMKTIRVLPISVPSRCNQTKIAKILKNIDDKIKLNNEINNNLSDQIRSIYKEIFIQYDDYKRLDEISNVTIGKTPPRSKHEYFTTDKKDIKWISISDLGKSGMFIFDTSEKLTKEAVEKYNVRVIPKDTVILSFKLTVGRTAFSTEDMTTNEAIAHFNLNNKELNNYLYCYLTYFNYSDLGSTSSIATAINSKIVKSIMIGIPSEEQLNRFNKLTSSMFELIKSNEMEKIKLSQLRDTLLPKLMNGEIDLDNIEI